jgi:DNA repair protein RadC
MIKDMLESERPRERLLNDGVESLSNEELLSIIIKTGTKNISVKELSRNILKELNNINDLKDITINKLINIKGIGKVKAIEIIASIELGKRVYIQNNKEEVTLNNSSKIYEYFKNIFINEKQENFYAIYLNTKSKLISYKLLFKGTINTSCVHPREIFKYAFLESAYSVVVIHNHPSGDPTPSKMDDELTQVLFNIGKVMSLPILDHIIIGNNKYYSYYEEMNRK